MEEKVLNCLDAFASVENNPGVEKLGVENNPGVEKVESNPGVVSNSGVESNPCDGSNPVVEKL